MCEFQSLYFGDDGYVVRCKQCGHFQTGYMSTMLTLTEDDFGILCKMVKYKDSEAVSLPGHCESVILPTPSQGVFMMLTKQEVSRFNEILEEADNEAKALNLMSLFNPQ